jgi:hypothetical protein
VTPLLRFIQKDGRILAYENITNKENEAAKVAEFLGVPFEKV